MKWEDIGKTLIGIGLPTLGTALAGPLGGAVGKVIADAIGTAPTPDAVGAVLSNDADPTVRAKLAEAEAEWARTAAASLQAAAQQADSIGQTQRAEIAAGVSWWHWRHLLGYVVGGWIAGIAAATVKLLFIGTADQITLLSPLLNSVWPYFGAACGLLGYVAMDTSRRTTAAQSGASIPTVLGAILGAIKKK